MSEFREERGETLPDFKMEEKLDCREQMAIVLPSLDPDLKFQKVIAGLLDAGFAHIVIVDDGSDELHRLRFAEAAAHPQCTVLTHEVNKGKGRALKTAFSYVIEQLPEMRGVITIDGDGQHLIDDIIACGQRMLEEGDKVILGCRDFNQPGIPPRSVAGNKTTSRFFRLLFSRPFTARIIPCPKMSISAILWLINHCTMFSCFFNKLIDWTFHSYVTFKVYMSLQIRFFSSFFV